MRHGNGRGSAVLCIQINGVKGNKMLKFNETPEQEAYLNKLITSGYVWNAPIELLVNSCGTGVSREQFEARDGWVVWRGGKRPVPLGEIVDVHCGDSEHRGRKAKNITWNHHGSCEPITAYRLHKPEQPKPEGLDYGFLTAIQAVENLKSAMMKLSQPKGHPHAELMADYAEDAKTNAEPWRLWEIGDTNGDWWGMTEGSGFVCRLKYRRKPKTKLIHGVEVPDIAFTPTGSGEYYFPDAGCEWLTTMSSAKTNSVNCLKYRVSNDLCYPATEEGKQAAILHAKIMLGIAK